MAQVRLVPCSEAVRSAAQSWQADGACYATIVIKATFEPAPRSTRDGALELADAPDDILTRDEHRDRSPARSLKDCSDLAPYLQCAEVMLSGDATMPATGRSAARLSILTPDGRPVLDKRFFVHGAPGEKVALNAENALGGPGHPDNPVGRANASILHVQDPSRAVLLGPIARTWRSRAGLLRPEDKKGLQRKDLLISNGMRWEFFHAAPLDQRIVSYWFSGAERIVLEGLRPGPAVVLDLPNASAAARWMRPSGAPVHIDLRADTLRIDLNTLRVSLTWRGFFQTAADEVRMVVATGISTRGRPIDWPEIAQIDFETQAAEGPAKQAALASVDATGILHLDGLNAATLPFEVSSLKNLVERSQEVIAPKPAIPGAPWGPKPPPPAPPSAAPAPAPPPAPAAATSPSSSPLPANPRTPLALVDTPSQDLAPFTLPPGLGSILLLEIATSRRT